MKTPRKPRLVTIRSRTFKTKRGRGEYTMSYLNLPQEIAQHVPPGTQFKVELVEEGILLRIIRPAEEQPMHLPSWAKK